jgi:RNA polymerase sigma-70 factor (ECF subfamily)
VNALAAVLLDRTRPPATTMPLTALVVRPGSVYQLSLRSMTTEPEAREAAEVMARYCRGDAAAFHRLYALLAARILAYLKGLLNDNAAAEDALQLTFLKVHEARSSYVIGANPIPWIYTIAHRTALDEIRKRKRSRVKLGQGQGQSRENGGPPEPAAHITGVAADVHPDPVGSSEAGADPSAAAGALAALAKLPENQRQALILTKVHGRSIADAAMITGSTPGAIKQRAHRAYVTLRQMLGGKKEVQ